MQADLRLSWSHVPHCWTSHVAAQIYRCTQEHFYHGSKHYKPRSDCTYGVYIFCIYSDALKNTFIKKVNTMNPDQEQSDLGLYHLQYMLPNLLKQMREQMTIVMRGWILTHLCRMYFPIPIIWTSPFLILGLLGVIFHFNSSLERNFCKQTVENLIRHCILRRLVWFCTACRCPAKRMLGLYGLRVYSK